MCQQTLWADCLNSLPKGNYNLISITENWLLEDIPDRALEPEVFFVHCTELKTSKRGGVCYAQQSLVWSSDCTTLKIFCFPHLEHNMLKCWPFWLPREVYILPQMDTNMSLKWRDINEQKTMYTKATLTVVRDFNQQTWSKLSPNTTNISQRTH